MTVEVTSYYSGPYITNGATTVFPFSFISMDADELGVLLRDADGVDTIADTADYSVTRDADGTGSVVFASAPASGSDLYIFSDVSFAQSVEFEDGSGWKASPVNSVADRSAARDIWLKGRVDRSLIAPIGETLSELPSVDNRLGKFLAFDAAGEPVAADGTGPDGGLRSDLAASGGSALSGFLQSGTGSGARTAQSKMRDTLSTADKTGPFLTALASIHTDLSLGGIARIPRGTHSLSATSTFTGDRLTLEGEGPNATIVQFDPASADIALEINKPGAGGSFQDKITGIGFYSTNSVDKTAISLTNTANVEISRVGISSGNWLGTNSIGVRSYGRQSLHLHNCEIATARPLVLSANALYPTINVDHYLIEHCELISTSTTKPVIEIEDGVVMSNITFRNIAIVGGYDGVLWNDTTSTGVSYQVLFENFRTEQGASTAAYSLNLGSTAQNLQNIVIRNALLEPGRNGIKLRNAQNITLDNIQFGMSTGTALDITFIAGTVLIIQNCTFLAGAAVTLTNAKRAFSVRTGTSAALRGQMEVWVYDNSSEDQTVGAVLMNGITSSDDIVVANDGTYDIATNGFTGRIYVDSSIGTGAEIYLAGSNNAVSERDDPYNHYSVTKDNATTTNVYWEAGTSRYTLQNKTGGSVTYTITMRGRAI